ncbi:MULTISPECIES: nickel pincer cofactor biosynthesis protein LarB [Thermoactinomyces]|uniref:Nickel pincer cofactor biosynthesis protein LarB n=1 Tax=Thermoactinomyces daqus TaxID=1329516 RepID=A0A7W1X7I0_9BACL|nr:MULTISPECIES: nickel pincer cofactor biosynthesis protein LarB [Thermoactinomyces]MBA4541466.1 nickel pincer cofactor biosynthesis protein LarB [Thermoactinomyces daqus]MBH8596939.1 nickel pincer cofactor biosynthesis protein LarB [Thermoactinomyces sp. CICC 10523]MBH8603715.1 nickel pincer cofactor biosynthesis protein LarB [Thermoactinomyces sp. CICC 10522]MBH8607649.1 nickel pincer cofactor biosynthesis protein LarB [Thermoactinomyces sp. CICC 10521]
MDTFKDIGFCKLDIDREKRTGYPEVIFGQGKTEKQVAAIFAELMKAHNRAMATRATKAMAALVKDQFPEAVYDPVSRLLTCGESPRRYAGTVAVVCAGTSDLPVAEEAAGTAQWMGCEVERIYDVGVAGIDRLLAFREQLREARVVIVVAGMEGALASVVGGLTRRPVIAVPTSVGYGAHFSGLTPLFSMLTSCTAGVTVVNIDNGFGAGYAAVMIQQLVQEAVGK